MYTIIPKNKFNISYVNEDAEVVLVGMSPGPTSNKNYNQNLDVKENNKNCAFSGSSMRANINKMLNAIHINKILNTSNCESIWSNDFDKVSLTSVLKLSVKKNDNFISTISYQEIQKNTELAHLFDEFISDCKKYKKAKLFVACGPRVKEILDKLVEDRIIKVPVVGIAHPSGQNGGRVNAYINQTNKNGSKSNDNAILLRKEAESIIQSLL